MGGRFIDLHTHSVASDGTDSPAELAVKALRAGVAAVALTDHDTLDGLDEAERAAAGLEFIRGCELAVSDAFFGELHILGLWMPRPSARMRAALQDIRRRRETRNQAMIGRLGELGLCLTDEDLAFARERLGNRALGRPHLAEALWRKGYVTGIREAFDRWLGWGKAAFVPRELYSPKDAIGLLADEGATVILAHPCLNREMDKEGLNDRLSDFRALGLDGLEAYHSAHDADQTRLCVSLAERHDLLLSGGSDYHGDTKPGIRLAVGKGGLRVPYLLLDKMREVRRAKGLWV